jgi:hypothetical protein
MGLRDSRSEGLTGWASKTKRRFLRFLSPIFLPCELKVGDAESFFGVQEGRLDWDRCSQDCDKGEIMMRKTTKEIRMSFRNNANRSDQEGARE